ARETGLPPGATAQRCRHQGVHRRRPRQMVGSDQGAEPIAGLRRGARRLSTARDQAHTTGRGYCRHCERSEAIQAVTAEIFGLLRRYAPRNDEVVTMLITWACDYGPRVALRLRRTSGLYIRPA